MIPVLNVINGIFLPEACLMPTGSNRAEATSFILLPGQIWILTKKVVRGFLLLSFDRSVT
jgi:hypothetical protein